MASEMRSSNHRQGVIFWAIFFLLCREGLTRETGEKPTAERGGRDGERRERDRVPVVAEAPHGDDAGDRRDNADGTEDAREPQLVRRREPGADDAAEHGEG